MSLRLLQKATTGAGGTGENAVPKGSKGKGKRGRRSSMSLQQFHQQTSSAASQRPAVVSAWGKGAAMRTNTWAEDGSDVVLKASGSPTRSQSESSSAWMKGPPSSAMDTLWDAPPTVDDLGFEDVWQAPAIPDATSMEETVGEDGDERYLEPGGHDEETNDKEAPSGQEPAVAMVPDMPDAPGTEPEDPLYQDICAWLRYLNLSEHQEVIYSWCEDMGAATLEEVVESVEDLLEAVHIKPLQAKRLQNKAQDALDAVRAVEEVKVTDEVAEENHEEVPASVPDETSVEGQSYYAPVSAGAARVQSYYKSLAKQDDGEYLKQRYTETATWIPTAKAASQGSRKRQHKQQLKKAEDAKSAEELAEQQRKEEAAKLLELKLQQEKEKKFTEVRASIAAALERSDSEAFSMAVAGAKEVGMPDEEIQAAEQQLQLALQRRLQVRHDALCALQATLETPKDEKFGAAVKQALEEAHEVGAIQHLPEGCAVETAAKKALQEWELAEQQRDDALMALQFALRRREIGALQVALAEATAARVADEMMAEASSLLQDLVEKERQVKEAEQMLNTALAEEDLGQLEDAVANCKSLCLPLRGADETLQQWRKEAAERQVAEEELQAALDLEDPALVREVIAKERRKLQPEVLRAAEDRAAELEALAKRREMARLELCLACNCHVIPRLEAAINAAKKVRLPEEQLQDAEDLLQELQEKEELRQKMLTHLQEAIQQREISVLKEVLQEAHGSELSQQEPEMQSAQRLLEELEEEARLAAEAALRRRSAEAIYAAVEEGDWDKIYVALNMGLAAGLAEEGAPVRAAHAKLDSLREAREQEDAQWTVEETEAKLEELKLQEEQLQGPKHKKERSAIGKEIMNLRNSEAYLSARNFLKNPEKERQRRQEQRLEIEKRQAEEKARRRLRSEEAPHELATAMEVKDEDALRALLVEAVLSSADAQLAETFLAELEEKRRRAERDGALLEFSFANLDRRAFFQASVTLTAFFADQYSMHEGSDFKLKVVKSTHSVLVAFQSSEYAEAVKDTAAGLAKLCRTHGVVLKDAIIKDAGEMSSEAEELLVSVRQDAEVLKARPVRPECVEAMKTAAARARGDPTTLSPPKATSSTLPRATTGSEVTHGDKSEPPSSEAVAPGADASSSGGLYVGKGHGKATQKGTDRANDPDVFKLPKSAAAMQKNQEKAKSFQEDLRTFGRRVGMSAQMMGFDYIQLRPLGFVPHDMKQKARDELRRLLDYHFPATREVYLRVHPESGAGIDLAWSDEGYLVEHVEEFPGQDLMMDDVIIEIMGHKLAGLNEDDMEETFGNHFGDGVKLTIRLAEKRR